MKRIQLSCPELYNVWKGQLYIQGHLASDIAFKSSSTCSIPAQLPSKLNIKEVICLSALKKALPAQIFDKIHITGQEECCGSVYYTLYAVKTSDSNGFDFDKLQEWMRDHKLALIKALNDQGFLILLTSSELQYCKDLRIRDSFQLFVLFLSSRTRLLDNTRTEDWGYKFVKGDLSLKVTELLPSLQHVILERKRMQRGYKSSPYALVDLHFKQFARLQRKNVSAGEVKGEQSSTSSRSSGHGKDSSDKCDTLAFSCLQSYLSAPVKFSVPLVKMSSLLKEDIPLSSDSEKCNKNIIVKDSIDLESKILLAASKMKSDSEKVLHENKKQPAKKRTFKRGGKRGGKKGRKKPTQQTAVAAAATVENQVSNKRRKLNDGEQQQPQQPPQQQPAAVSSTRMTVKLASAPNAHRRKRGAEVLTAEFVTEDKVETETTATSKTNTEQKTVVKTKVTASRQRKTASAANTVVRERPPKRKASEPANKNKLPDAKTKSEIIRRAVIKHQEQSRKQARKTAESSNTVPFESAVSSFVKSSLEQSSPTKQSSQPAPVPKSDIIEKRINMYESHALNLLADLALNSFSSSSMSFMNSEDSTPTSEPALKEKVSNSDREEAAEDMQNYRSPPSHTSSAIEEPVEAPDFTKSPSKVGSDSSPEKNTTPTRAECSEKQASHKMLLAAAKAKARNSTTSKISLEHSYSQLPRENMPDKSPKEPSEKPVHSPSEPTVTNPDSEVVVDQSPDYPFFPREFMLMTGDNGSPSLNKEPQDVSKFQDNFMITFKWEPNYDFDLDSKFTSDPLEKTINRALHGPWNPHLKEKVEDVKIILHMWLALFYSKPSQLLSSSSRKVVEHSNPAKYVSINTVHDPLYDLLDPDGADSRNDDESDISEDVSRSEWRETRENDNGQPVDLRVGSKIQTKDVNVSEIFQMLNQSSVSALYTDSLQTTVRCKMTSASKGAPPNPYYMDPIIPINIPNVCYTDGGKQFNTELSARSETRVAIGGGSSEKVNGKEREHEYSRQTQKSSDSEKRLRLLREGSNEESAENFTSVSPGHTESESFAQHDDAMSPAEYDIPEPDGFSDHSDTEEDFLKNKSPLTSPAKSIHANSEQHETELESTDDLPEAKLQDVHPGQSNEDQEPEKSNVSGKAVESGIQLRDDNLSTVESPKASRAVLVHSDISTKKGDHQDQARTNADLLPKSNKEVDSGSGSEVNDHKDSQVKDKTNEEMIGKRPEQVSDEHEKCKEGSPLLAKNDTEEVASCGKMGKLHLSSSSSDTSDEDMETGNVGKSDPANAEKTEEEKSHANEETDVVTDSAEAGVAVCHQDNGKSPKDDGNEINTVAIQSTDDISEINAAVQKGESLVEVENIVEIDESENLAEDIPPIGEEISVTDTNEHFGEQSSLSDLGCKTSDLESMGEKPSLPSSESNTVVDSESLGEKSMLLGSESNEVIHLETLGENSSLLESESGKAADLEKLSVHGSESNDSADLECISVFEKLSLKAIAETNETQTSTLAKKQELHNQDSELLPAENETDNDPSVVDLCGSEEAGNTHEKLQEPCSEVLNTCTPEVSGKTRSPEGTQDSESATDLPVSKGVDGSEDQLLVESQNDETSDILILSPGKPKMGNQSMKNTIRKEILSKLKRICRGAGLGQTSSNSEDEVVIVHEKPGKLQTEEPPKQTDDAIVDLSDHEMNTESLTESTSKTQENETVIEEVLEEIIEEEMPASIPSVTSPEPVVQEAEKPLSPEKAKSPINNEVTENMDQGVGQKPSDICCIINTGSISKEQYDRWSASDDDVEFVRSYKEPIKSKTSKSFQNQSRELHSSTQEEHPTVSKKAKHSKKHYGPDTSQWEEEEYHRYHRDPDYPSPRSRGSIIVTKKLKDVGRARSTIQKESYHAGRSDLDRLITSRRTVSSDLTQNTLDMERLRFMCKLKEVLRKSSTDVQISEPPFQTMFESKRIPGGSRSRTKSRRPLLITVHCTPQQQQRRRDYRGHASSSYSQAYYEDEPREKPAYYPRTPKKVRTPRFSTPYHFNRLRLERAPEKPSTDISVIIKECTQSNHQRLSRVGLGSTAVERTSACPVPEETDRQIRQAIDPTSTKSRTVGTIITDLYSNLRTKLHSVARESAQKNCYFYLCKTFDDQNDENDDDDGFFTLTKSLLIKDGYAPIDPQDFCEIEQAESSKLLVVIKNEDVSSQIYKIPHLLQLRLLPNVRFAGVDTPEDLSESMYQDLFQTGGFVVSDKAVLENLSIGKLKEILTILEKLNRTSAWKWLIHYGEYRKLKEDKRAESVSRKKIPMLKSYQQSNVIEILPYHRCDSRSTGLSSDLECLLSLQSQHIRSRLAVWLTVTPSTEAKEMEQNGILVYDVDTFIRRILKVDAQFHQWS